MVLEDNLSKGILRDIKTTSVEKENSTKEWVEKPSHYSQISDQLNGLECWDFYTILLRNKTEMPAYLAPHWGNVFKYTWRCFDKPGDYGKNATEKAVEDMQKVMQYAAKFIIEAGGEIPSFDHVKCTIPESK